MASRSGGVLLGWGSGLAPVVHLASWLKHGEVVITASGLHDNLVRFRLMCRDFGVNRQMVGSVVGVRGLRIFFSVERWCSRSVDVITLSLRDIRRHWEYASTSAGASHAHASPTAMFASALRCI